MTKLTDLQIKWTLQQPYQAFDDFEPWVNQWYVPKVKEMAIELLEARALLRSFQFIPDWPRAKVTEHLDKFDGGTGQDPSMPEATP